MRGRMLKTDEKNEPAFAVETESKQECFRCGAGSKKLTFVLNCILKNCHGPATLGVLVITYGLKWFSRTFLVVFSIV